MIPKFEAFIATFPSTSALADADLADVLRLWQGLGYNRRAKYLHDAARMIEHEFGGTFPSDESGLLSLPGVGKNTAGAIMAYAFNRPVVFIETNIRTVYIHHFFDDQPAVDDKSIANKVAATLDAEHPREFYWALMDYGSWLKSNGVRNVARSSHYKKQSPLEGSLRQMRGRILRELAGGDMTERELAEKAGHDDRFEPALSGLTKDGLVSVDTAGNLHLTK